MKLLVMPGQSSRVSDGNDGAIAVSRAIGDSRFIQIGVTCTPIVQVCCGSVHVECGAAL